MSRTPDQDFIDWLVVQMDTPSEEKARTNGHGGEEEGTSVLSDEPLLDLLFSEREKGQRWRDCYEGRYQDHYPSPSEAVAALLCKFAYYSRKDRAQMRRLIRGSALASSKFDESRSGSTWIEDEIQKAIIKVKKIYGSRSSEDSFYSHHTGGEFGENKSDLPIKTVEEVVSEAGDGPDWIIDQVLARGALTDFAGLAKKGGKTTFWIRAIVAGARGEDHAGFNTVPAKYLYLTEQGNNFVEALRDSGLTEYSDHVRIVQFKDVPAVEWEPLIREAGAEAKRLGLDALVVDTFAVFARLRGAEENDSGAVADRMRALRIVGQTHDIGVVLIRHAGKDGTPRGSSAFEAEADICITISRPEGRHAPTVRHIAGIGRYGEWERNIQLHDGRYISLGSDNKVEFNKAVKFIKAVLPSSPEDGIKKQDLLDKRTGADTEISASTLDRALAWLVKQDDVGERQLVDQRGKPKVYWLAYKEPEVFTKGSGTQRGFGENKSGRPNEPENIYSHQTPFTTNPNDENKSKGETKRFGEEF